MLNVIFAEKENFFTRRYFAELQDTVGHLKEPYLTVQITCFKIVQYAGLC